MLNSLTEWHGYESRHLLLSTAATEEMFSVLKPEQWGILVAVRHAIFCKETKTGHPVQDLTAHKLPEYPA
jgi:hypothetical protein